MGQPANYSPTTDFSDDERNNAGGRSTVRTDRLDAELDAISQSINGSNANLALIQRDDGKLRDALVEPYNLSAATKSFTQATKWTARGLWSAANQYNLNDMVDVGGVAYICAIQHVSVVFATDYAAGRWQVFTSASSAAALAFAPTTNLVSTNAQAAIQEADANARSRDLAPLSSLYGGF